MRGCITVRIGCASKRIIDAGVFHAAAALGVVGLWLPVGGGMGGADDCSTGREWMAWRAGIGAARQAVVRALNAGWLGDLA